jgi:2-phospho-L-lactate/phosphoenolpyruvate guanylyltransferase
MPAQPPPGHAILIPAKQLSTAKSRLGAWLGPSERRELAAAMLADVVHATAAWRERFVVTGDAVLAEIAAASGCLPIPDPGDGLNAALRAGGLRAARAGAASLLVLPSDVPLVAEEDVAGLFATEAAVVVARSLDGGTTGLLRTPPGVIDPAFGPHSAHLHAQVAMRAGVSVAVVAPPSLALDVDGLADLQRLAAATAARRSVAVARRVLGSRIA